MTLPTLQMAFRNVEDIDDAFDLTYTGDPADFLNASFRCTLASATDPADVLDFVSDVGAPRRIACEIGETDANGVTTITFTFQAPWRLQQGKTGFYSAALLAETGPHARDVALVYLQLTADPTFPRNS